jgi:hypothetical protein
MAAWSRDSCSTPLTRPARRSACGISDATSSTGDPTDAASPNAASALAAPGPVVTTAAPSVPVARAHPSAA